MLTAGQQLNRSFHHNILPLWRRYWWLLGVIVALTIAVILYIFLYPARPHTVGSSVVQSTDADSVELIKEGQVHLPGSSIQADGLHIHPTPFAIVNQDGSGGQPNPPVNLYGAHLHTSGNLTLKASLKDLHDGDSLSLYGQVPIIYDEFRYERNTLQLTFRNNQLQIQSWVNSRQQRDQTFNLPDTDNSKELILTRGNGKLNISVNGHKLGTIQENRLFSSGDVWFGATAATQEWRLASLRATRGRGSQLQLVDTTSLTVPEGTDTWQSLAARKKAGFTLGAAVALAPLVSDTQYAQIALNGTFGSFTTENALKWQFVHPAPDTYDFQEADALVALAQKHHVAVHGHTLLFGEANPKWVQELPTTTDQDKAHVRQVMQQHIAAVASHYRGKMTSWDVVNEPLADYAEFESGQMLRNHVWYKAMNQNYISQAFQTAHAADPQTKLYINEFGLEEDGERWDYFLQLVTQLKQAGVPLDGVGFQAHVYEAGDQINPDTLKRHMQQLADIGLTSHISEMDVYSDDGPEVQTQQYTTVLQVCLQAPSCDSFTTWGISDRYDMFRKDSNSTPEYGQDFLWDSRMRSTPAATNLQNLLR